MKYGMNLRKKMMSGDQGMSDTDGIIFYHDEMTEAKKIVLQLKGIKLDYLKNKNRIEDVTNSPTDWEDFWENDDTNKRKKT